MDKKVRLLILALAAGVIPSLLYASSGSHGESHGLDLLFTIASITNAIIFAVLMYIMLKKPVIAFFKERSETVEEAVMRRETVRKVARDKIEEYAQRMDKLEKQWEADLKKYQSEGEAEHKRIIEEAKLQAEKIKADASKIVEAELRKAKHELRKETATEVIRQAEKLLSEKITDEDRKRLVGEYIDMLS